jgi:hypothetical protein
VSENLLPCPFCGASEVKLYQNCNMSWVACISCGLEAPGETGVTNVQAIDYWNTRPASSVSDHQSALSSSPQDIVPIPSGQEGVREGVEETPTKGDFAKWSRVWHDTCETIMVLLGLPGGGSPQEMLAQVQSALTSPAGSEASGGGLRAPHESEEEMENYRLALAWISNQSTDEQSRLLADKALTAFPREASGDAA